ncbi:Transmembrane and TPR repeat-containing protein [Nymphon striatum]|nr:Transmembrane and TPR repeat-containing protein [Nymphon striatum]KAG1669358.1 Transmembrane and TPR repeat-containing protein [Nymphon striatum]KAG1669359.1 Transmembrane and TPR repeat-containing protein [Nymphon striatum]
MENNHQYQMALEYYKKAKEVQPEDIGTYINIGRTYSNLKMQDEAEEAFLKALNMLRTPGTGETYTTRVTSHHLSVFLSLATLISKNASRLEEADKLYKQAIRMREDYIEAYINRGDVLIKLNRTQEAQETYQKALQYEENNPDIYHNLAIVAVETGNLSLAMDYLNKALEIDPDHRPSLLNSAVLIQEYGTTNHQLSAYQRLLKVIERGSVKDETIYYNLGMIALDLKDFINAEKMLGNAIKYKADFKGALFNLALMLSDQGRLSEAAHFLHQLLKYHPGHVNGLLLLGDIYINHTNDLDEAEKCYRAILAKEPNHVQSLHNLCVVFYKKLELDRAETCFLKAEKLAPEKQYIQAHLSIVQKELSKPKNADVSNDLKCLQNSIHAGQDCLVSNLAAIPADSADTFIK